MEAFDWAQELADQFYTEAVDYTQPLQRPLDPRLSSIQEDTVSATPRAPRSPKKGTSAGP